MIRGGLFRARTACFAGAVGATTRTTAGLRFAATSRRTARAATLGSGRCAPQVSEVNAGRRGRSCRGCGTHPERDARGRTNARSREWIGLRRRVEHGRWMRWESGRTVCGPSGGDGRDCGMDARSTGRAGPLDPPQRMKSRCAAAPGGPAAGGPRVARLVAWVMHGPPRTELRRQDLNRR